jgi:transcriptional regulator with XRE-family HTH domain
MIRSAADAVAAVKRRVAALGWTQEQVEHNARLTAGHWAKIASGRRVPNLETIEKLLRAVGLGLGLIDLENTARSCSDETFERPECVGNERIAS